METAITALIVISILILSMLGLSERSLLAQATISEASRQMQERVGEMSRTNLSPIAARTLSADSVEVTVRNTGNTRLADFNLWDVIVEYDAGGGAWQRGWFIYTAAAPLSNQWTVAGIYVNAALLTPEAFERNIFDPGEEMVIRVKVSPPMGSGTTNQVTLATPNGIRASTIFTR